MTLSLAAIVPHVPRICFEDRAPDFQRPLIVEMKRMSGQLYERGIDAVVLVSCHWMSTFFHFVDVAPEHKGILTAFECPELISNVPYYYPGDPELANAMVNAGKEAGIPVVPVNDPTYVWDYGTVVPLRYLVPKEDIPVIDLSVAWAGSLEETYQWGKVIGNVIRRSGKRVAFFSSGTLSHNLARGAETMPTLSERALNQQFTDYMLSGDFKSAWEMLPQFSRVAGVESGGRHLAMLLGVLDGGQYKSALHAEAQSSGSWNQVLTFDPV